MAVPCELHRRLSSSAIYAGAMIQIFIFFRSALLSYRSVAQILGCEIHYLCKQILSMYAPLSALSGVVDEVGTGR